MRNKIETRRQFLKDIALGASTLSFSYHAFGENPKPSRPNVVLIIPDNMTGKIMEPETRCITPNVDSLAAEGVRLHRYYTTNPNCCPARASFMTGTYPSTHHIWGFVHGPMSRRVSLNKQLAFWSQHLAEAGYTMGYFGKWHVEHTGNPRNFGFHEFDRRVRWYSEDRKVRYIPGTQVEEKNPGYETRLLAAVEKEQDSLPTHPTFNNAIDFIHRNAGKDKPFCCVFSFTDPHPPITPPKQFYDMYDVKEVPLSPTLRDNLEGKPEIVKRLHAVFRDLSEDDWRQFTTCYNATVTFIDSEVGRLVKVLKDLGAYENTIIIFTADHGGMRGGHGLLSHCGSTPYEEVYQIPFVIRGPGIKARGEDRTSVASHVDLGPTLVDLCGAKELPDAQGRSMRPALEGRARPEDWQDAYAEHDSSVLLYSQRITWHGSWKYTFSPGGIDELYNLDKDPHEEHNLASDPQYRPVLEDMVKRMWRKVYKIDDKMTMVVSNEVLHLAPVGPLLRNE